MLPVLAVEQTFLLACLEPEDDFLDRDLQWVVYVALSRCTFEISLVLNLSFVIAEDRVIHLYSPNPNCGFWGEWDAAAFYFPADFLRTFHICFSLFVYLCYLPCSLFVGVCACMCIVESLQQVVLSDVGLEALYVCHAAFGQPAI